MAIGGNRGPDPEEKTEDILRVLRDYERPFMGTGELAEELGYSSNPGVTKHLERAVESNAIEKTTISGYNIWYLPDLVELSRVDTSAVPAVASGDDSSGDRSETGEIHEAGQMGARRIGSVAVGIALLGLIVSALPPAILYLTGLCAAGLVGLAMAAWGAAPLVNRDPINHLLEAALRSLVENAGGEK